MRRAKKLSVGTISIATKHTRRLFKHVGSDGFPAVGGAEGRMDFLHVTWSKRQLVLNDGGECGGNRASRDPIQQAQLTTTHLEKVSGCRSKNTNIYLKVGFQFKEKPENCRVSLSPQ